MNLGIGKYLPDCIDNFIDRIFAYKWWKNFKKDRVGNACKIVNYHQNDSMYKKEIDFLQRHGANYFPYSWAEKRDIWKIKCGGKGEERYVVRKGKKLFLTVSAYASLAIEQNPKSPHAYFSATFFAEPEDCFVDIGAAEGMISLDIIDIVSKCILIECDEKWKSKLAKSFETYKEKTTIISKFVSNVNDDNNITLDELLKDVNQLILLKIDVEGMEDKVIEGAKEVLSRPNTKVALCTYHKPNDDKKFKNILEKYGFKIEFSDGYMAMLNEDEPPYFRKAMIRAKKE